jgi:23S rRNA (cytidine1920-2'-O)/16S rRNA (cytidine1409-2'-O)-methyltransferase
MSKQRVDLMLVERGLAESRAIAQRLVMAGQVRADGQVVVKPSVLVSKDAALEVDHAPRYVSRGGEKLEAALAAFAIDLDGAICADVGASTGGFTDCLLQHGAGQVYAIDVGRGQLHWRLRQHPQVEVMEKSNARHIEHLPQPVDLVTIDASFISLKVLLRPVRGWFGSDGGQVIALIKPQFEAGRREAARGKGVIKDPEVHRRVLVEVLERAQAEGYGLRGLIRSPLLGPRGNIEFLAHLAYPAAQPAAIVEFIDSAMQETSP